MSTTEPVSRRERRRQRKMKKVAVFANAKKAGIGMGREQLREGVERIIQKRFPNKPIGGASAYVEVHTTHSLEELGEAKERTMRDERPDILIVLGGDGTTQKTLGEDPAFLDYLTRDPESATEVVVIGAGSKNVVPTALKLLGADPLNAFDVVCQKIVERVPCEIRPCPILKINGRHGFIYGSGVVVNALDEYYRREAGRSRAFRTGLGIVWRETLGRLSPWRRPSVFRRFGATMEYRDHEGALVPSMMSRFNAFIASSLREINPWLKVTYRAGEHLKAFHALGLNNGFWRSTMNFPSMIVGAPMVGAVQDVVTSRLVIRYDEPTRHTIDGELYDAEQLGPSPDGSHAVTITTGPYIKFIRS